MSSKRDSNPRRATERRASAPGRWMLRLIAIAVLSTATAIAQTPPAVLPGTESAGTGAGPDPLAMLPPEELREVLQWAADSVRQVLPESYHGEKDWGKKKRVYAGVEVDFYRGRLSTRRRWTELGHGRWIRYDVHLVDPADPERLNIRINRAEQGSDQRIHFETQIDSAVDLELHQERWSLGTRLFSVSVKATAKLRMRIAGNLGFAFDPTRIPPDILIDPKIVSTELVLVDLQVSRISKIGGEVADAVGDLAKQIIREEYLPRQQAAMTAKLNAQIERRRDRLRFGASQWISRSLPIAELPIAELPIAELPAAQIDPP